MKLVLPPSKLISKFSSSSTVDCAVSVYVLALMPMRPPSKKRKPDVGMRVYSKAVDVASGPRLSCFETENPAAGFDRGCPSAMVSV